MISQSLVPRLLEHCFLDNNEEFEQNDILGHPPREFD